MNRLLLVSALAVLTLSAQQPAAILDKVYSDYWEHYLRENPEAATSAGRNEYNSRWSDASPSSVERNKQAHQDFLARARAVPSGSLTESQRLSQRLFVWIMERRVQLSDQENYLSTINHFNGPHLAVFSVAALSPAQTVKDFEDRIARIEGLPQFVDAIIANANEGLKRRLEPPRMTAELMTRALETQLNIPVEQSPLYRAFSSMPASIPAAEQQRLQARAKQAYEVRFRPAWSKLRSYLNDTFIPKTRVSIGLSGNFNGKELYSGYTKYFTTTNLTPEQIHATGVAEMARIQKEMAAIRQELNFTGTPEEFEKRVLGTPEMSFKSEAEILAHGRDIAKRIDPELPRLFRVLPRMPYGVQAIPPDRARTAAPYYQRPALDGSRAGNFFLRTFEPEKQSKCCMEALILHEAVPGHHLQIALAQEMQDVPEFRRAIGFTAFIEGWALYAETLGPELGLAKTPYERYGKLQQEVMRSARLVVDTGIHAMGWTRERAIQTMTPARGGWINDDFLTSEVDRYIAYPGQALAYKIGGLKIQELRRKSETALGTKFDIREFHDVVLRNGALPLEILEEEVDRYLAVKKR